MPKRRRGDRDSNGGGGENPAQNRFEPRLVERLSRETMFRRE